MHRARKTPRQDAFAVQQGPDGSLLVIVCDGVGDLPLSERAAQMVCDTLPGLYRASGDWVEAISQVNAMLREAEAREQAAQDTSERLFATTVTACRVRQENEGLELSFAYVGDSELWALTDAVWRPLVGAAHEDGGLYSTSVRPIPTTTPMIGTGEVMMNANAVFLFTDGVSVPLAMGPDVQSALAAWWRRPPDPFTFASQVGFARRGFVDDRTAVGVWSVARLTSSDRPADQPDEAPDDAERMPPAPVAEGEEQSPAPGQPSIDKPDRPVDTPEETGAESVISDTLEEGN